MTSVLAPFARLKAGRRPTLPTGGRMAVSRTKRKAFMLLREAPTTRVSNAPLGSGATLLHAAKEAEG